MNPGLLLKAWIETRMLTLLCGLLIPLDLFPAVIKHILDYLPFQYYVYYPYQTLIGGVTTQQALLNVLYFTGWIAGISVITLFGWTRSMARYTAVGG